MSIIRPGSRGIYLSVVTVFAVASVISTASVAIADSEATSTPATASSSATSLNQDFPVQSETGTLLASTTASENTDAATSTHRTLPSQMEGTDPSFAIATTTARIPLTCTSAYTAKEYDSPSGHEVKGAAEIGMQSWVNCHDEQGRTYEFRITPQEYRALSYPNAHMPTKFALPSSETTPHDNSSPATTTLPTGVNVPATLPEPIVATSTDASNGTGTTDQTSATSTMISNALDRAVLPAENASTTDELNAENRAISVPLSVLP